MSVSNTVRLTPQRKWADTKRNPASETDGDALLSADTASPPLAPSAEDGAALRAPDGGDSDAPAVTAAPPRSKRKVIIGSLGAIALATAAWFAYDYVTVGQYIVSTEDAYVGADMAILSPKVSAHVADVPVVENQSVKEGDVLVRLDDGDYRLAVSQAEAKLATQTAAIATFDAQIRAAEATAQQARAQLDAANATVAKTEADFSRTKPLVDRNYSSKATLDAAIAARDSARAQVKAGEAAIETADANVALLRSQRAQAEQIAKELDIAVAQARRDLSFTVVRAPFDGVIGNKSVQVGDYVTPGKRLAALVPLDEVYVDANLKETQLAGVVAGEAATVKVDALGGSALKGTVVSIAPASGSQFSLLPPENATGNFTKIVQRVPVRIAIPAAEAQGRLRPGLSVVVDIDTRSAPQPGPAAPAPASTASVAQPATSSHQ